MHIPNAGRVEFCRFEGYFDDNHPEWDHDEEANAKRDAERQRLMEIANGDDDGMGDDDEEGGEGAVLPW